MSGHTFWVSHAPRTCDLNRSFPNGMAGMTLLEHQWEQLITANQQQPHNLVSPCLAAPADTGIVNGQLLPMSLTYLCSRFCRLQGQQLPR